MRDSSYIVFSKKGLQRMMKGRAAGGSRQRPQLGRGEFAVLVTFDVPDSIFAERPVPEATVRIPERQVIEAPLEIEVNDPPAEPGGERAVWKEGEGWVLPSELEARNAGDNRSSREGAGVSDLREPDGASPDHGASSSPEPEAPVPGLPDGHDRPATGDGAG